MNARLFSLSGPDDVQAQLAVCDELETLALELDRPLDAYTASMARYLTQLTVGDAEGMRRSLDRMAAAGRASGAAESVLLHERLLANGLLHQGRFAEAEAAYGAWLRQGRRRGLNYAGYFNRMSMAVLIRWRDGERGLRALPPRPVRGNFGEMPVVRARITGAAFAAGDHDKAAHLLELLSVHDFEDVSKDSELLHALVGASEVAAGLGDRRCCQRLYALLEPYEKLRAVSSTTLSFGVVAHYLGLLAAALGQGDRAQRHLSWAVEEERRLGHTAREVLSQSALLQTLSRQGAEPEAIAELRAHVETRARRLGMTSVLDSLG